MPSRRQVGDKGRKVGTLDSGETDPFGVLVTQCEVLVPRR